MTHDIKALEGKINRLNQTMTEFATLPPGFGQIIHKPGFTSVAEFALLEAGIDYLNRQMEAAVEHCKGLLKAAEKVGEVQQRHA